MAFSIEDVRLDGCIAEPSSPDAYRARFEERTLPEKIDLRRYCSPVENQGHIGSCTANATVGALEYHYIRHSGASPNLSRLFVYFNARQMQGDVRRDTGATIPQAMASVLAFGACQEDMWPYDPRLFADRPPPQAYEEAKRHEAVSYARVDNGNRAVQALAQELPVVFGIWLPRRCYEEAARTGVIPEPAEGEPPAGGHSMLIVGYDNGGRTFLVRNSWGVQWGDQGYCRIPFDVMEHWAPPDQFWVIGELAQPGNLTLIRPATEAGARAGSPEKKAGTLTETAAQMRDDIRSGLEADIKAANARIDSLLASSGLGSKAQGRSPEPRTSLCSMCGGTGRCYYCRGTGVYAPGTPCARCGGSGKCYPCNGTGVVT